ncbi:MAG: hypothetical protein ABJA86_04565 [Nocardioidaceae bacterium]
MFKERKGKMLYYVMETLARQRQEELAAVSARPIGLAPRSRRTVRAVRSRATSAQSVSCQRAAAVTSGTS